MVNVFAFIKHWRYKTCNFPGGAGGQCVDLANEYLSECWGQGPQHLNAVDWQRARLPGMVWVPNGAANVPPLSALVVWHAYAVEGIGAFGHIAIACFADAMHLCSFDQNWPEGAACGLVLHDFGGVAGWHQPAG